MVFNNYYLWLLTDFCFITTDNKAIAVLEKNTVYEPFVRTMMNIRIQAIFAGSSEEKFCKLLIKASYRFNTLYTEKFGKIKLLDKADTFIAYHHLSHIDTRRINAKIFAVQFNPKAATCFTSLLTGKCLDRKPLHFVLADTESIQIAIAGDPNKNYHQQFESIVTDKQFYDQHVYQYLPDPNKDIYDYKKILGFGIENEGYELTSLGPKDNVINTMKHLARYGLQAKLLEDLMEKLDIMISAYNQQDINLDEYVKLQPHDYQLKPLSKFERPYFSPNYNSWKIDQTTIEINDEDQSEQVEQQIEKRSVGRPKKYFNDEDRKEAIRKHQRWNELHVGIVIK
ncbi:MAG: hypothetical protein EZS28_014699 [Streblomastix strix]|uniref:Uncharacterized protein n=1 Tax=Streblomastix strix TaxID=222440 RepID=A0A5J4W5F6_9EUKA|nr:MAG: hypothetical protein EZS28_014699 [Streblomastix strix]